MEKINGRTPEEIKRWLRWVTYRCDQAEDRCATCEYRDDCGEYCGSDVYKEALALIERLEAQQPKWISVKERLPEKPGTYGAFAFGLHLVLEFDENEDWWDEECNHYNGSITHWMPLPEPPKEDAHE